MKQFLPLTLMFLLTAGLLCGQQTPAKAPIMSSVDPSTEIFQKTTETDLTVENGLGQQNRDKVIKAHDLILEKHFDDAIKLLDDVIKAFEEDYIKPGTPYVSVATKLEYDRFVAKSGKKDTIWLDWSYMQAYFLKAFIATEHRQYEQALQLLEKVHTISPDDPGAYCEMGNILNGMGQPRKGLEQYLKAYELTKDISALKDQAAIALRGIGFSCIELGDLDKAEEAYNKSLELNPDNKLALNELKYIRSLRSKLHKK